MTTSTIPTIPTTTTTVKMTGVAARPVFARSDPGPDSGKTGASEPQNLFGSLGSG